MNGTEEVDELVLKNIPDDTPEEVVGNDVLEVSNGEKVEVGKEGGKDPLDERVVAGTLCVLFSIVESGRPVSDVPLA